MLKYSSLLLQMHHWAGSLGLGMLANNWDVEQFAGGLHYINEYVSDKFPCST